MKKRGSGYLALTIMILVLFGFILVDYIQNFNLTGKTVSCSPNLNCTDWIPKTCPENEIQTRSCIDLNNCNTTLPEIRNCTYTKTPAWILIPLGVIVIIIVFVVIVLIKRRREDSF